MTAKSKSQKGDASKRKVNHESVAWALASVLYASPESRDAEAIMEAWSRLGGVIGQPETVDLRSEYMLRDTLDAHTSSAYDLDGQDKGRGTRDEEEGEGQPEDEAPADDAGRRPTARYPDTTAASLGHGRKAVLDDARRRAWQRDPDSGPDANFDGYSFWLDELNDFNGNYITAEMVKAFITSTEHMDRFGSRL